MAEWIPIKKKPPKSGKWYIFTDGLNISVERYKEDAIDHFFPPGRWFNLEDAVAWMPLPNHPYAKKSDNPSPEGERKNGMNYEVYRLTLEHFVDNDEERIRLEEPLAVEMIYDRTYTPLAVCLNSMIEMIRNELLKRVIEGGTKEG